VPFRECISRGYISTFLSEGVFQRACERVYFNVHMRDSRALEHLCGYFGLWVSSWKFEIETYESERGGGEGGYSQSKRMTAREEEEEDILKANV
jgi:hypothetical protein